MTARIDRRELVALIGAAAWPMATRAQQADRIRRVGVLMNLAADDPESPLRLAHAVTTGLQILRG
jgi:putative ABC transport system substrate-binding protein